MIFNFPYTRFHYTSEAMRILFLCVLLLTSCSTASSPTPTAMDFSGEAALKLIEDQLAFGPRYPGSEGHTQIQDYLIGMLLKLDWRVEIQQFSYRGVELTNIIARHPQATGDDSILLGAHYDTRQFADRDPDPTQPVPGANDGASGVAVLLELARVFSRAPHANIVLVFFDGEDQGHIEGWDWAVGSRYYVDQLNEPITAAIIVDMVGDKDLELPYELASDPGLIESIWETAKAAGFTAFIDEPGTSIIDDHIPFLQAGIPAVDIIDIKYPYWHTRDDRLENVSSDSLYQVGRTLEIWLETRSDMMPAYTQ